MVATDTSANGSRGVINCVGNFASPDQLNTLLAREIKRDKSEFVRCRMRLISLDMLENTFSCSACFTLHDKRVDQRSLVQVYELVGKFRRFPASLWVFVERLESICVTVMTQVIFHQLMRHRCVELFGRHIGDREDIFLALACLDVKGERICPKVCADAFTS